MSKDKKSESPFTGLLSSKINSNTPELLESLLLPYCNLDKQKKSANFEKKFFELSNDGKLIICLLLAKARSMILESNSQEVEVREKDLHELNLMARGSVKSSLSRLRERHFIKKGVSGYFIPDYTLSGLDIK